MDARAKIDPELAQFLAEMRAGWKLYPPFETLIIPERRIVAEKVRARWTAGGPEMARTMEHDFRCDHGRMRVRVYLPRDLAEPAPALLYLHGGGFTLFSIDTHDRLMREYAERGRFAVIGVDYPLAPENKYPVALDCIVELLLWLKDNGDAWGVDPQRLAIGGDSAGANLSFAAIMRLRDLGETALIKAVLSNYGGFASTISDESEARFGGPGSIMDREEAKEYWANYLRDAADAANPYACPIHADVGGFPPAFLVIPQCDIVTEHSIAMAERLRQAGVPAMSKIYPGAIHSFLEAMSISTIAREAIDDGARFIAGALG